MKSMNTMSPVAELPEATENATHAVPDALPADGAPQAPAPEAGAHDAGGSPAAAFSLISGDSATELMVFIDFMVRTGSGRITWQGCNRLLSRIKDRAWGRVHHIP